jgi:hypothetical protein
VQKLRRGQYQLSVDRRPHDRGRVAFLELAHSV